MTERVFWSNVKSYTGTCRHTCSGCWKVSLLQLSMTVGNGSFVWLCPLVMRPTWGSQGTAGDTSLPRVRGEVVPVIAPENNGSILPLLSIRVFAGAPHLGTQDLCSLLRGSPTHLSLSLSIFPKRYSILLERPSIWAMNYSEYFLLNCSPPVLYEDTATSCSLWVWFNTCHFLNQYNNYIEPGFSEI